MTTSTTVRVFVNAAGYDLPAGATALDAVRSADAALAEAIADGRRLVTDSRGIAVDPAMPVYPGAILRVVSNREAATEMEDGE